MQDQNCECMDVLLPNDRHEKKSSQRSENANDCESSFAVQTCQRRHATHIVEEDFDEPVLGCVTRSRLWTHDRRDVYKGEAWEERVGKQVFSSITQALNTTAIRALISSYSGNELQDVYHTASHQFTKRAKLAAYNTLLQQLNIAVSEEAASMQGLLAKQMDQFCVASKELCPNMSMRDIYRASTNAWPMFTLQYLKGEEMHVDESVLGEYVQSLKFLKLFLDRLLCAVSFNR